MVKQHQITGEEAVRLLSSGNIAGMEMLYDTYAGVLYGVIFRIVKNEEIAEDLLQQVCHKIWDSASQMKGSQESFFSRIIRMARNAAVDKIKSREYAGAVKSRNHEVQGGTLRKDAVVPGALSSGEIAKNLDPEHKEIIDLMFFDGHSQIEVALKLHIPLTTVKTRARTAVLALRKSIEKNAV